MKMILVFAVLISWLLASCAPASVQALKGLEESTTNSTVKVSPTIAYETQEETFLENTITPVPSPSETMTIMPSDSPVPTETPTPTPAPLTELPVEHYITGVRGHKQYFALGCEASVAVDWAAYFGVEINEFEFQHSLPSSDNPDLGFVGSVDGPWGQVPPYAYGVHAAPVAALLQEYGLNAVAVKELRLEELKRHIAMDHPVIAWVIGNVVGGVPYRYTDSQGNTTVVAAYEHTIIVIGYNEEMIRYNNNGRVYDIPTDVFLNSWAVLGNMAIVKSEE